MTAGNNYIRMIKINLCNVVKHNVYVGGCSVASGSLHKC
jgi:hypothetical protein